jgi:hypothetical protein
LYADAFVVSSYLHNQESSVDSLRKHLYYT